MNVAQAHVFSQINDTLSTQGAWILSIIISASSFPLTKSRTVASTSLEDCMGCQIRSQIPCDLFFRGHFMSDTICHREGADRIAPIIVGDNTAAGVRVYLDIPQPELDTGNLRNRKKNRAFHNNGQICYL